MYINLKTHHFKMWANFCWDISIYTHAQTQTHAHTHTHTHTLTLTLTLTHTQTHTDTHKHIHTRTHARTHARTHIYSQTLFISEAVRAYQTWLIISETTRAYVTWLVISDVTYSHVTWHMWHDAFIFETTHTYLQFSHNSRTHANAHANIHTHALTHAHTREYLIWHIASDVTYSYVTWCHHILNNTNLTAFFSCFTSMTSLLVAWCHVWNIHMWHGAFLRDVTRTCLQFFQVQRPYIGYIYVYIYIYIYIHIYIYVYM